MRVVRMHHDMSCHARTDAHVRTACDEFTTSIAYAVNAAASRHKCHAKLARSKFHQSKFVCDEAKKNLDPAFSRFFCSCLSWPRTSECWRFLSPKDAGTRAQGRASARRGGERSIAGGLGSWAHPASTGSAPVGGGGQGAFSSSEKFHLDAILASDF